MNEKELKDKWLRQQTDCVSLVLNDNELHLFKSANYIVNRFMIDKDYSPIFIAVCYHDKDLDEFDKSRLETPHYQCVVYFKQSLQFKTIIKLIQTYFPMVNDNQIGLEKANDLSSMARYVLHRGFYDKYQYSLSELYTNDMDLYMKYYNMILIKDQIDCITVVEQYHYDLKEIVCHVSNYQKWRSLIKDLITDNRNKGRY